MRDYHLFESLLFHFCRTHQIGMIRPDAQMHYSIFVDMVEIRCFATGGYICIYCDLSDIPTGYDQREINKQIMHQSLLDGLQSSSTVSLNAQGELTLFQRLELDNCQLHDFEASIEQLVAQAEQYQEILQGA